MGRASRIPYHQNVYDLLQIEPGESPEAARMIADHEAAHGPLPAAVKEWYLVPNVVPLRIAIARRGTLWHGFSNDDVTLPLEEVLGDAGGFAAPEAFPTGRFVCVAVENQGVAAWWVELDGSDDPPVRIDGEVRDPAGWTLAAPRFSDFVFDWIATYGFAPDWSLVHETANQRCLGAGAAAALAHANGLWLRAPAEPFVPAVIDYLTERLVEPERTPRAGNVTTYTFRPAGGTVRVTADEPGLGGGLSAWWMHAETPERLADLARLVLPFGTLRDTLRADTDAAREVLRHILGERGA